jgi:hypothetical protein
MALATKRFGSGNRIRNDRCRGDGREYQWGSRGQVTGYRLQVAGCGLRVAGSSLAVQGTSLAGFLDSRSWLRLICSILRFPLELRAFFDIQCLGLVSLTPPLFVLLLPDHRLSVLGATGTN